MVAKGSKIFSVGFSDLKALTHRRVRQNPLQTSNNKKKLQRRLWHGISVAWMKVSWDDLLGKTEEGRETCRDKERRRRNVPWRWTREESREARTHVYLDDQGEATQRHPYLLPYMIALPSPGPPHKSNLPQGKAIFEPVFTNSPSVSTDTDFITIPGCQTCKSSSDVRLAKKIWTNIRNKVIKCKCWYVNHSWFYFLSILWGAIRTPEN